MDAEGHTTKVNLKWSFVGERRKRLSVEKKTRSRLKISASPLADRRGAGGMSQSCSDVRLFSNVGDEHEEVGD